MKQTRWLPPLLWGFDLFFRPLLHGRLAGVYLYGLPDTLPERTAVILVANHVSWWDGFMLREIHRRCARQQPLYTLMLERQLRHFPFFRWMGAVGIVPDAPASVAHALRFLKARREQEGGVLWLSFFPQGRIWPSWRRPLHFQQGLRLFVDALRPAVVLPVGLHLEPLNRLRPSFFISVGRPLSVPEDAADVAEIEQQVTHELDRIFDVLRRHGEDAPRHWPGVQIY